MKLKDLRKVRKDRGLRLKDLAKEVRCDTSSVSRWERGLNKPCYKNVQGLERALGQCLTLNKSTKNVRLVPTVSREALGKAVHYVWKESGAWTSREFAKALGTSPSLVRNWSYMGMAYHWLPKAAKVLDVSSRQIVRLAERMEESNA